jgi:two-component system nitrate/nitrite response regulator NarL
MGRVIDPPADRRPTDPTLAPPVARRVIVVDADHRVRHSLADLLAAEGRLEVVGQAGDAGEALRCCEALAPDVVVVDPRLPDVDAGTALLAVLRRRVPGARLLVRGTPQGDGPGSASGLADGILPATLEPAELVARVSAVAEG